MPRETHDESPNGSGFFLLLSPMRPTGDQVHDVVYEKLLLTKHSLGREPRSIDTRLAKVLFRKEDKKN